MKNIHNIHGEKCEACGQPLNADAQEHYNNHKRSIYAEAEAKFKLSPQEQADLDKQRKDDIDNAKLEGIKEAEAKFKLSPQEQADLDKQRKDDIDNAVLRGQKSSEDEHKIKDEQIRRNGEEIRGLKAAVAKLSNTKDVSNELKGSLQHKEISKKLKKWFPDDEFVDTKVGENGGDIRATVIIDGKVSGKILIESKRLETSFLQKYIDKIIGDTKGGNFDTAMFVTNKFPDKIKDTGDEVSIDDWYYNSKQNYFLCPMNDQQLRSLYWGVRNFVKGLNQEMIKPDELKDRKDILWNTVHGPATQNLRAAIARQSSLREKAHADAKTKIEEAVTAIHGVGTKVDAIYQLDSKIVQLQNEHLDALEQSSEDYLGHKPE